MTGRFDGHCYNEQHWGVIVVTKQYHAADKRSRTNPGHGYPAHTTEHLEYRAYKTEDDVISFIKSLRSDAEYKVIRAFPADVETKTTVTIRNPMS